MADAAMKAAEQNNALFKESLNSPFNKCEKDCPAEVADIFREMTLNKVQLELVCEQNKCSSQPDPRSGGGGEMSTWQEFNVGDKQDTNILHICPLWDTRSDKECDLGGQVQDILETWVSSARRKSKLSYVGTGLTFHNYLTRFAQRKSPVDDALTRLG